MNRVIDRTTDAKARVSLPKSFANTRVVIEEVSDTEVRIRKARVIPEGELPFEEEGSAAPVGPRPGCLPRPARPSAKAERGVPAGGRPVQASTWLTG